MAHQAGYFFSVPAEYAGLVAIALISFAFESSECGSAAASGAWFGGMFIPGILIAGIALVVPPAAGAAFNSGAAARSAW